MKNQELEIQALRVGLMLQHMKDGEQLAQTQTTPSHTDGRLHTQVQSLDIKADHNRIIK
jgi:hypothetical protein